ncbi:MAG: hypothetical protein AB7S80_05910 [Rhizobiaceae bacterium]
MRQIWSEAAGHPGARPHFVDGSPATRHALRLGALGVTASKEQRVPVEALQPPGYSVRDLRVLTGWDWPTANAA